MCRHLPAAAGRTVLITFALRPFLLNVGIRVHPSICDLGLQSLQMPPLHKLSQMRFWSRLRRLDRLYDDALSALAQL